MADSSSAPMYVEGPRTFVTTDQDHGGVALVICTLMATWSVLCWIVRVYMRATVSAPFGVDDLVCTIATIFGIIQMIVSCVAISYGFGKSTVLLSADQVVNAEKALYAAQLLYIVTNALAKATVALLLARIVFIKSRVLACYCVLAAAVLWGLGSFLTVAIRCTDHPPWQIIGNDQCPSLLTEWKLVVAFNVIIELALFALPVWLVWGLQTSLRRKVTVVSVFGLRLPVIAAAIARIYFLNRAGHTDQPLLTGVPSFICLNIEMHYAVMSATFPTLKPFVAAFNTSWGTYDSQGISGYGSHPSPSSSYAMNSLPKHGTPRAHSKQQPATKASKSRSSKIRSAMTSSNHSASATRSADRESMASSDRRLRYGKNVTSIRSNNVVPSKSASTSPIDILVGRSNSHSSQDSNQMIIRQTMTCEVHYEEEDLSLPRMGSTAQDNDSIDFASPDVLAKRQGW